MKSDPHYVTLISTDYGYVSIVRFLREGPKNYIGYPLRREETGEERERTDLLSHCQLPHG